MDPRHALALCGTLAACALAACGGRSGDQDAASTSAPAGSHDTTTVEGVLPADPNALDTTAAVPAGAVVTVDSTPGLGRHIADRAGRPLYLYTADGPGESRCYDACAALWPPMIAPRAKPSPGSAGVRASMLGSARRRDGGMQVNYNNHPLYYYQADQGAARPQGNDVKDAGGEWYLVTPGGEKLDEHGEDGGRS